MIALIFNIIALILSVIPVIKFLSYVFFLIADICSRFMVYVVNIIAELPITVAILPTSAYWCSFIIIAIIIGHMYFYEFQKKRSDFFANSL